MAEDQKRGAEIQPRLDPSRTALPFVVETGVVGTILVKRDGQISYANPAFASMLGYSTDECLALSYDKVEQSDGEPTSIDERLQALARAGGERRSVERRYLNKNGEVVWVLAGATAVPGEFASESEQLAIQAVDISRQKRLEAELFEKESRWNFALESSGQGVWDLNFQTDQVFHSRMWSLMRGFRADDDEAKGHESWLKRVHPDDRERISSTNTHINAGGLTVTAYSYREQRGDGTWMWVLSRGRTVEWDSNGNALRFVGTDTDISELKAVEANLAEEKERLRVTLHSIGDGVISTDAAGIITFMNPVAEKMTGWPSADAVGHRVEDVFSIVNEADDKPAASPVAECLAREQVYYMEEDAVLLDRDGERRAVRDSAAPVRTPDGTIIGAVLVFQDVTTARALQKELAHSAMHDALTGLPNRSAFQRALTEASNEASRERREHALCFVDLDRFKSVNDTAGHAAGDALLQQIANAIRRACRAQDLTARIGGDEFAVLLSDCSMAGAKKVAQQIIDAVGRVGFTWQGISYDIGASVGITPVTHAVLNVAELMRQADSACYAAKASGRNRYSVYEGGEEEQFDQAV